MNFSESAWNSQAPQFRPQNPAQPLDDGSGVIYGAPGDPSSLYFGYPPPGPYSQFARMPMIPRPYGPGVAHAGAVPGSGMVPAFIPYPPYPGRVYPPPSPVQATPPSAAKGPGSNSPPSSAQGLPQPTPAQQSGGANSNGTQPPPSPVAQQQYHHPQPTGGQGQPPPHMFFYAPRPPESYHAIVAGVQGRPPIPGMPYVPHPQMYGVHPHAFVPAGYPPELYAGQPIMMAPVWQGEAVPMPPPPHHVQGGHPRPPPAQFASGAPGPMMHSPLHHPPHSPFPHHPQAHPSYSTPSTPSTPVPPQSSESPLLGGQDESERNRRTSVGTAGKGGK
ncbi:hypothetical protein DFJ73DRAFT_436817 [Zopfochytrium polystomum]|nr:hypothetical protein DFJ73DRAFT_436817 [Zopfochytrium polystomum]